MGCKQCNKVDVAQLGYGFRSLGNDETGRERKKTLRSKVNDELKQKFMQEIKSHGQIISEDDFNYAIGQDLANEYKKNPYHNDAFKEPDPQYLFEPGPIKLNNGAYYNGTWNSNGQMDGQGQFFTKLGGERLYIDGFWDDGNIACAKVKAGNNTYEGCIKDGLFNGKGKMKYEDKTNYEGDFKDGKKDGIGKFTFRDGTVFEGNFVGDEIGNKGKFSWSDGKTYDGELNKGIFNGKGTLNVPNKAKYEGEFKNGIFHGKGKYTWYDYYTNKPVDTYDGEYFDGKKNGYGVYTFSNKERIEGYFESGELQGECKYYSIDGYTYTLQYAFGQVEDHTAKKEKRSAGDPRDDFDHIKLKEEDIEIEQLPNVNTGIIKALYLKTDGSTDRSIQGYKFEAKANESSYNETGRK